MKRLLILSLIGLFGLSCFTVGISDAEIEIEDMYGSPYAYDYDGFLRYYEASLYTDIPYDGIEWSIGDDPDDIYNTSFKAWSEGDGSRTYANFYPNASDCPGSMKGTKYVMGAKAWYYDDEGNSWSDYEAYIFTVYKPKVDCNYKQGVWGNSELSRQYYDGNYITIDCYTYAYNPTDTARTAHSKFRHTLRLNGVLHEEPDDRQKPAKPLGKNGGTYSESDSLSFPVGKIREDQEYNSDAYIRLTVSGIVDTWFVGHDEDFTEDDNP